MAAGWIRWNAAALGGPAIKVIQCFLVADAMPNSIQPPILRQTGTHLLDRLLGLQGESVNLLLQFFVADFNFFLVSDLFQDE